MSELNFVFGFGLIASVLFSFYLGEHPEIRTTNQHYTVLQVGLEVGPSAAPMAMAGRANLETNKAALEILKLYEGISLEAYPQADQWFIGYGHKGPSIHEGMSITPAMATRYLRGDLVATETFIRDVVAVPLNENEFSALVALSYNIGNGSFKNSTVLRLLNEGQRGAAADAFLMWNKVKRDGNLTESARLTGRRIAERGLFLAN
jgi:lysozyme